MYLLDSYLIVCHLRIRIILIVHTLKADKLWPVAIHIISCQIIVENVFIIFVL